MSEIRKTFEVIERVFANPGVPTVGMLGKVAWVVESAQASFADEMMRKGAPYRPETDEELRRRMSPVVLGAGGELATAMGEGLDRLAACYGLRRGFVAVPAQPARPPDTCKLLVGTKPLAPAPPSLHDALCRVFGYSLDADDEQLVATARKAWGDERVAQRDALIGKLNAKLAEESALVETLIGDVNRERNQRIAAERIAAEALFEERKARR